MTNTFKDNLYTLLKKDSRLWDEERKELNQTLLKDLIDKYDEEIIDLLLSDKNTKEKFFIKINKVYVLKQSELKFFIDENKLDNSYTQYPNKIGLRVGNKLLSERDEVVLDWPFKDCVLEGGMTKEDQKRNEIFFNEVLAKDEIDRLEDPKVLVNWKRFTTNGVKEVKELKRDVDGTIRENLIIKGNNLLALHSLKEQFSEKIKLIYIDPPYNSGSDGFNYNDNFNQTSWLVFMKNRIEAARQLLTKDGVMVVQIDDNQLATLKVLMDEIFNKNNSEKSNFVQYVEVRANVGAANEYQNPFMPKNCEYLLIYSKNYNDRKYKPIWIKSAVDRSYSKIIINYEEKDFKKWKVSNVKDEFIKIYGEDKWNVEGLVYKFVFNNAARIFQGIGPKGPGAGLLSAMEESANNESGWSVYARETDKIYCYKGRMVRFYSKNIKTDENGEKAIVRELGSLWTDILWNGISKEGGVTLLGGKKPEKLLKRIVNMSTEIGDIVLDYHLGSGTTCAVAHKMGRQYIGIEQLDYGENDSVVRLSNVINGDQSGISKSVDWKGGGDFIYIELAKWNEEAKRKISDAKSLEELEKLFDELYERYFLNYNVKTKTFKEKVIKEDGFKKLSLDEQKSLFIEMLDMNQMYVNFSERSDIKYGLSKEDIALSEQFYNKTK